MDYCFYSFADLNLSQLYQILRLRQQVFMLEQKSFYEDIDNLDQQAQHLCVISADKQLMAYARLRFIEQLEPNTAYAKIERVVVDPNARGKKLAAKMMDKLLEHAAAEFGITQCSLSAQVDVADFYAKWGFKACGDVYDDGGIDHVDMELRGDI